MLTHWPTNMPSPIAHTAAGFFVYTVFGSRKTFRSLKPVGRIPGLFTISTALSLLPDLDSGAGILAGDFGRYHNNATHSFIVGIIASLGISVIARWRFKGSLRDWFLFSISCYALHVVMDSATIGRGVMAWWPFSAGRWQTRTSLFYGFHWSDGWFSGRHLWTFISELIFATLLVLLTRRLPLRETLNRSK